MVFILLGSASSIVNKIPDSCLIISPRCGTLPAMDTTKPPIVSASSSSFDKFICAIFSNSSIGSRALDLNVF